MKKLYLGKEKKFLGVCSGVADYFGIDPTLIRIIVVCVALATVIIPLLIAYVIISFVLPSPPADYTTAPAGKRLVKGKDKKLAGVCSGIADYFGIDPTIVRLIFALFILFIGYGVMTYIVCLIMMPSEPETVYTNPYEGN